jgi:sigma-B regulation protein RsbU (phosphoserine phosphatase)
MERSDPGGENQDFGASAYNRLQQELIVVRTQLDRQITQLMRLNHLSDELLDEIAPQLVTETFVEAIVDVLDVGIGALWLFDDALPEASRFALCGIRVARRPLWASSGQELLLRLPTQVGNQAQHLPDGVDDLLPGPVLVDGLVCRCIDRKGRCLGLLLAANCRALAGMAEPVWQESLEVLSLLAQKLAAHLDQSANRQLRREIRQAHRQIDQSQSLIDSYQKELSIAAIIQGELLPSSTDFLHCESLDAVGFVAPCKEVGGDFYDIIELRNLDTMLVVGDVSGKGLSSALMMSSCITLARAYSEFLRTPSIIISKINDRLVAHNETCMFTTLFVVYLDSESDELVYCNAGHNPAFLVRESGGIELLDEVHGPAVGVLEGSSYLESRLPFHRGDRLVLYTDGVSEAFNERGELFGYQRIHDFLAARGSDRSSSRELLDGFFDHLNRFIGAEPAHDDIALLSAYRVPSSPLPVANQEHSLHHRLTSGLSGLGAVKLAVREFCKETAALDFVEAKLQIILDELIANIINYGVSVNGETVEIDLVLVAKNGRLNAQLIDNTQAFDPFSVAEPDLEVDLDDRAIGGLGIYLVRQLTDLFHYERVNGRNVVVLEVMMAPVHDTPSD